MKQTILIRSVVVPVANIVSNVFQLMAVGVPLRDILKGTPTKLVEIDQYLKNRDREVELGAQKARHRGNDLALAKIDVELASLKDSNERMSIWPLIKAGEFATISEGMTDLDAALTSGRWVDWMKGQIDRIPQKLGTAGRYAVITQDTALFQGMARATQYGDFIAKAVLYEHMTKREKKSHEDALKIVTEEFVNYNLLPGRTRSYAESIGATWFWAYKLRALKTAHRMLRDHPARAFLMGATLAVMPDPLGLSVGSPASDNIVSTTFDGRLGYTTGWDMLFRGPSLHPWVNITS